MTILCKEFSMVNILKVTPGACLQHVIIEGAVKPARRPLISWYNKDNVGMLHKFMVKEPRLLWNGLLRTWTVVMRRERNSS
ncbi:mitochondrial ubiquitin ligase activator of nfkb 1-A-like isoform X2 [Oreochromis niloticus]|uniref:mitochondrial ubiquitin ligase activator of nfkb 1-A-like n=1 Tax=Oreochromis niloticus TaxID=8128 RepID=UPI000905D35F|nr:mitochondrial ubiquitin ligase activator of nfkb 1-A-like [Oreochromis niloticus]XP_019211755.1 mitochondrial ubiquitin ligase activator of nfkb 1-A-like isoform X2 [Oreochromis niloticus]